MAEIQHHSFLIESHNLARVYLLRKYLEGSSSPRRESSATAKHPPCQAPSLSLSEKSWRIEQRTSSAKSLGSRAVTRPIPLAADQRMMVSPLRKPNKKQRLKANRQSSKSIIYQKNTLLSDYRRRTYLFFLPWKSVFVEEFSDILSAFPQINNVKDRSQSTKDTETGR